MISRLAVVVLLLGVAAVHCQAQQNSYRFTLESVNDHTVLSVRTAEPLSCIGYTIRNSLQWEKDTVVVIFSGFVRPIPCVQGLDAATARIVLKRQARKLFYLKFREDTFSNLWKISVSGSGFRAEGVDSSFTSYSQ